MPLMSPKPHCLSAREIERQESSKPLSLHPLQFGEIFGSQGEVSVIASSVLVADYSTANSSLGRVADWSGMARSQVGGALVSALLPTQLPSTPLLLRYNC